ncbi:hypothetical protein N9B82_03850 [Saprospiraceae bacterium]|nr:hypothetical protein [Saprospiraceae bacterium]
MKILLLASTTEEISKTIDFLETNWEKKNFWEFTKGEHSITTLITGIGTPFVTFAMARMQNISEFDYIVNPGISVALSRVVDLGRVYLITEEGFADIGLEESDGSFSNMHDLEWMNPNKYPFLKSKLKMKSVHNPTYLPTCTSLTVNTIPGTYDNIENFEKKYHVDMLTVDGGAVMYTCKMLDLDLIQFCVASRHVEPWQKETGDFVFALDQLNMRTIDILKALVKEVS